jgi:hypothetical protein
MPLQGRAATSHGSAAPQESSVENEAATVITADMTRAVGNGVPTMRCETAMEVGETNGGGGLRAEAPTA